MLTALLVLTLTFIAQSPTAKTLQIAAPELVGKIDTGKLKGEPTQLGWSPDAMQLFLQTSERDAQAMVKNPRYFVLSAADAKPQPVAAAPEWGTAYWRWKSDKSAPGAPRFSIDVKREERTGVATASPMGGSLARGGTPGDANGGGTTVEEATMRAQQMQKQQVITLTLKNEVVGEFVNQQFLPGYTFGWAPQNVGELIAYRNQAGRLAVMDDHGQKQEIADTKEVLLPAWSADGSKIAFLQKTGKNKYDLMTVSVKQ
jgi:hypothetical protein